MVRTTQAERDRIREVIAGVYNAVFEDHLRPADIELTQLLSEDNEMDVYPPRFGVNIALWRRWGAVKKLEVILHELAHVQNPEDNHRPAFYHRFVDVVEQAEAHWDQVEEAVGEPVDITAVKRRIVQEVHEGAIDQRMDSVGERRRWLRQQFGLSPVTAQDG